MKLEEKTKLLKRALIEAYLMFEDSLFSIIKSTIAILTIILVLTISLLFVFFLVLEYFFDMARLLLKQIC